MAKPRVFLSKPSGIETNTFSNNNGEVWYVANLIERAKGLEPFELPLAHIDINGCYWNIRTGRQFLQQMKRVWAADLQYPVIMDGDGFVMDGWHRIMKAIFEDRDHIMAVRFDETPPCDYIRSKE